MTDDKNPANENDEDTPKKVLSAAAKRALEEAEIRRNVKANQKLEKEYGGRGGEDPSRFGDWEINGRAIDF